MDILIIASTGQPLYEHAPSVSAGYNVVVSSLGVSPTAEHAEPPALVIIDLSDHDKIVSCVEQSRTMFPLAPIVVISTGASVRAAVEIVKAGASDIIESLSSDSEFSLLINEWTQAQTGGQLHVTKALEIISRCFREDRVRLCTVAQKLQITPAYLCRLLKQHTGHGFRWHLARRRAAVAAALLGDKTLRIKEIAGRSGFRSTASLDRVFRREHRCSPSAYRRRSTDGRTTRKPR